MATFFKFDAFVHAVFQGKHNLDTDAIKVALCNAANAPVAGDAVLADLTTVSLANLASDVVTLTSAGQTSGTYKYILAPKIILANADSLGPFRYLVLYNSDAPNDELICSYDRGDELTLNDGSAETFDFPPITGIFSVT